MARGGAPRRQAEHRLCRFASEDGIDCDGTHARRGGDAADLCALLGLPARHADL